MASGPAVMIGANLRLGSGGLGTQNVSVSSSPAFQCHPGGTTEAAIIFCLGSLGMAANFALMVLILTKRQLRRWSQGLLFHQAVVDGCRAAILLPLGVSIYYCQPVQKCSLVETAFLLLVTVSTVNMLTTVLNDSPVFPNDEEDETDLTAPLLMDSPQCVLFGVFMIWFASITINLGPTFLSGALAANSEAGHNAPSCPLVHGPLRHYVLNLLWIIINVICVGLTLFHLHKLHRDLTKANVEAVRVAGLVTTLVSVTGGGGGLGGLSGPTSQGGPPRPGGALDEHRRMRNYLKRMEREGVQRVKMFLVITGAYVLFWGPLFFVTLVHHPLIVSPMGYEITLHVAYVHAFVNPTLFLVLHRGLRGAALDVCCGCCLFLADWILGAAGVDRPPQYTSHRSRRHTRTRHTAAEGDRVGSPAGSVDLPPPPHPPASSVSEISLLKQKSSSTTDVGVMTQPIVPIDHPILTTQSLGDENLMYNQPPWGRAVDVDQEANRVVSGGVPRPTSRVGPMAGTPPRAAARGPSIGAGLGAGTAPPAAAAVVANHSGGPVSPGRYLAGRKDYEDEEEEDSAACSSVSD